MPLAERARSPPWSPRSSSTFVPRPRASTNGSQPCSASGRVSTLRLCMRSAHVIVDTAPLQIPVPGKCEASTSVCVAWARVALFWGAAPQNRAEHAPNRATAPSDRGAPARNRATDALKWGGAALWWGGLARERGAVPRIRAALALFWGPVPQEGGRPHGAAVSSAARSARQARPRRERASCSALASLPKVRAAKRVGGAAAPAVPRSPPQRLPSCGRLRYRPPRHVALDDAIEQGDLFCNLLAEARQRLGQG